MTVEEREGERNRIVLTGSTQSGPPRNTRPHSRSDDYRELAGGSQRGPTRPGGRSMVLPGDAGSGTIDGACLICLAVPPSLNLIELDVKEIQDLARSSFASRYFHGK